jgi:pimeloyl-ACP methyl ester carboxylesterase
MPVAELRSAQIYYECHGQGDPLVLVCGLSIDHSFWQSQISGLSREFQVIIYDNRDSGQSKCDATEYSIDDMADDLANLLDELRIAKTHLLGFSMGGFIAQSFAARYPEKLKSLILVGTAARVSNRTRRITINWLNLAGKLSREDALKEIMLWLYSTKFFENDQNWRRLLKVLLEAPQTQTLDQFNRQARALQTPDMRETAKKIKAPTLVLVGSEERVFTVDDSEELVRLISGAKLQVLPRLSHNLTVEDPTTANSLISAFCRGHKIL